MNRPTCETCPFWEQPKDGSIGQCRKNAPLNAGTHYAIRVFAAWPETGRADWCGEHPQFADFKFQWRQAEIAKLDEQSLLNRCDDMFYGARCILEPGHPGNHQHTGLVGTVDEPDRCPIFIGGERCGKRAGHDGKHVWERGD